jgi:hypothetical protein
MTERKAKTTAKTKADSPKGNDGKKSNDQNDREGNQKKMQRPEMRLEKRGPEKL